VGFRVVEELARRWGISADHLECNSLVGVGVEGRPWLARPQTYMNRSGHAARCLLERYGLDPAGILVVYDEINLPLGRLRLRRSGSPAGHRGLESILESLRSDQVPRLRLGIAPETGTPSGEGLPDFVLAPFAADEQETVAEMIRRAADACEVWVGEGVEVAMNRFNG
jgi:peptidyl-tRNA hydrolase, PTH1 family